jgi:hypothetical protein
MNTHCLIAALLALGFAGCASVDRYNSTCSWPTENHVAVLDLGRADDRRHLDHDALIAEDLAIRYADHLNGRRSGQFRDGDAYHAAREQCMATLFATVARIHGVDADEVREAAGHRNVPFDGVVLISFATLYWLVARRVAGRITVTFGGSLPAVTLAVLFGSLALSIIGVLFGDVWSGVAETIRIGNGHASYRANRIPWRQYPELMFAGCVVLFWVIAAVHYLSQESAERRIRGEASSHAI